MSIPFNVNANNEMYRLGRRIRSSVMIVWNNCVYEASA
jgi:hypothetical protein